MDLTNYTGSLAKFFNGVDLDVLEVICNTILPQTDYSYCLYNAKFSSLTNVEKFLKKVGYISNASYMFAETIIDNIDIMEQVVLGKNAILKGSNFAEGATMKERNLQIGGHKA